VLCRNQRLESSFRRLDKVARTHRILNPDVSSKTRGRGTAVSALLNGGPPKAPSAHTKYEPRAFGAAAFKRSAVPQKHMGPSEKSGIKFQSLCYNSIILLHESQVMPLYVYQLSRDAYTSSEVKNAKRFYHRARRYFSHWEDIFGTSSVVRRWMRVISITLRLAERAAARPGCSLRERRGIPPDPVRTSSDGSTFLGL